MKPENVGKYIEKRAIMQRRLRLSWFMSHKSPPKKDNYVYLTQYRGHMTAYAPSVIPSSAQGESDAQIRASIRMLENSSDELPDTSQQTRGAITVFSQKSRLRMIKKLSSIRNLKSAYFITLTYPGLYLSNPERVKRDIDVLVKRLKRRWPVVGYMWRMELKKRLSGASQGQIAPHYHLIITGVMDNKGTVSTWMRENWGQISRHGYQYSTDEIRDHSAHGTDVKAVENEKHAMWYVSKYAAKVDETDHGEMHPHGRHWSCGGNLDVEIGLSTRLTRRQWVHLKRLIAKWMQSKGVKYASKIKNTSPYSGCTVFGLGDDNHWHRNGNLLTKMIKHARELKLVDKIT